MKSLKQKKERPVIRYERYDELHKLILMCREVTIKSGEPSCMVLEGVPGAGKTTLAEHYASSYPRYETKDGSRIPVFYLLTPSPVTVKGMAAQMLLELGDPGAHKGTLQMMNARLIHYLRACQVELVILDDFHHLIDLETNRIMAQVSDWLKVLIKKTGIPFLVVGIENSVERILQANQQLSRLFAVREKLSPFKMTSSEETENFSRFLEYAQKIVGMEICHNLPKGEFLWRMHVATNGIAANIMNLLYFAAELSGDKAETAISLQSLDIAFNIRLQRHIFKSPNPFTSPFAEVAAESSIGLNGKVNSNNIGVTASELFSKQ